MAEYPVVMRPEFEDLKERVDDLEAGGSGGPYETPSGAQTKANTAELNAKAYVDALLANTSLTRVRGASTSNANLSSPGATVGGVTAAAGNRFLLAGQTTGSQNAIYVWSGAASAMTRATDFDTSAEIKSGMLVVVTEGTNADTVWKLNTDDPITLGTNALSFTLHATGGGGGAATVNGKPADVNGNIAPTPEDIGIDMTPVTPAEIGAMPYPLAARTGRFGQAGYGLNQVGWGAGQGVVVLAAQPVGIRP